MHIVVKEKSGKAIQQAIDEVFTHGGGVVALESGVYPSGTLYLKSNVELHVPAGAVIQGYADCNLYDDFYHPDYPVTPENCRKALLVACEAENIALTGNGELNGQGPLFYDRNVPEGSFYRRPATPRPRLIQFFGCKNVTVEGINLIDSAGWSMWMCNCRNVHVSKIRIEGDQRMMNNDGFDIDCCCNVTVSDSFFKTGDDCLVLRAIRRNSSDEFVCENVTVSNSILNSPCQGIRIGCPSDDTIRHCRFSNITFNGRGTAILSQHPERYLRKNCTGYASISDISFNNFDITANGFAVYLHCTEGINIREINRLSFNNFRIKSRQAVLVQGHAGAVFSDISFNNITGTVADETPLVCRYVKNLKLDNVDLSGCTGEIRPAVEPMGNSWETFEL